MGNPVCAIPNHGGQSVYVQSLALCFESIKLGRDDNSEIRNSVSRSNNPSSPDFIGKNFEKIKNQSDVTRETSDKTSWSCGNPLSNRQSIWGDKFFVTEGEDSASNPLNDSSVDLCKPEISFDDVSSIEQPIMEPFLYPSMSGCVGQFESNSVFSENPIDHQFTQKENNGLFYGTDYGTTNNYVSCGRLRNQEEIFTLPNFFFLKEILEGGDYDQVENVLWVFQGCYLSMMIDKRMLFVFQNLLDACRDQQLHIIVAEILSRSQLFINAAFWKQGAISIIRLIKKMKRSHHHAYHALAVTNILSTRFLAIMTDEIARAVIQNCFIYFGQHPNNILYENLIDHFQELAIHKVGCRALNEAINTISGEQRTRLLNHIADSAAYLSNDPYGNYVVQNVLMLNNGGFSARIMLSLQGQFVELAKKTGGSHIVEKCMESSGCAVVTVVEEILNTPEAPCRLARNKFGNYVIQKALKKTTEHGLTDLYYSLVESLLPYREALNQTPGGMKLLNLLRDDRMEKLTQWKRVQ